MKSYWDNNEAAKLKDDPLSMRVYTSRLLGRDSDLVLHGGGNTSLKHEVTNLFGERESILFVKGSGWDLATIEKAGFAPVKMDVLLKMANLPELTDSQMVKEQRAAMTDPSAPNPSVEAILHAIIPFKYVDHTHADRVVTITNTEGGQDRIKEIYGESMLIVPYVMPGFILARKIYELTRDIQWTDIEGMILLNHGVFTFHDDARCSYEKMIEVVSRAETYMDLQKAVFPLTLKSDLDESEESSGLLNTRALESFAAIRREVSIARGAPVIARLFDCNQDMAFSEHKDLKKIAARGPLTPDHVIRTKQLPALFNVEKKEDAGKSVHKFTQEYVKYFKRYASDSHVMLDPAPRWAVWLDRGVINFGATDNDIAVLRDITQHTMRAILEAEVLGGWKALPASDIFDVEYWELEQAKLKKKARASEFTGRVVCVTGAASGIGRACVDAFVREGAAVVALDINADITSSFSSLQVLGLRCDITDQDELTRSILKGIKHFGGLDVLVSNAGIFPESQGLEAMNPETWDHSLNVNLSSHQRLLTICIPFLKLGLDPAVVIVGSKNVPAPGPGAAAYSVPKAGLTQLARVAALELGKFKIRVNVIHPNQIFDTAIWTREVLTARAKQYDMTVDQYKKNNVLGAEIQSSDVARLVIAMAGRPFSKTTGAQVPIDGGNTRVI